MTPLYGAFRAHKNALLAKNQLGAVKPTMYDLPSATNLQHEYGLRQLRDGSSSAEVLTNWAASESTSTVVPGRDFRTLNKRAAVAGAKSCKDVAEFRATNDARLQFGSYQPKEVKPYTEDTSFGRASVSNSNFNDLFSHSYRYDWVANAPPASDLVSQMKPKKPSQTKSSRLLAEKNKQNSEAAEVKEPWKMKAFTTVPARVGQMG